jgi:hypothetical protein
MSEDLKKILDETLRLQEKISKDPTYKNVTPSVGKAYAAIRSAMQMAQRAEGTEWEIYPTSRIFGKNNYTVAREIAKKFKIGETFTFDDFRKRAPPSSDVPDSLKWKCSEDEEDVWNFGPTQHAFLELNKKGFIDKRKKLTEKGKKETEYQINKNGYKFFEEQEEARKFTESKQNQS